MLEQTSPLPTPNNPDAPGIPDPAAVIEKSDLIHVEDEQAKEQLGKRFEELEKETADLSEALKATTGIDAGLIRGVLYGIAAGWLIQVGAGFLGFEYVNPTVYGALVGILINKWSTNATKSEVKDRLMNVEMKRLFAEKFQQFQTDVFKLLSNEQKERVLARLKQLSDSKS